MATIIYNFNVVYTALIAGLNIMYCITLGSYFTFIAKKGLLDGFTQYYSVFRRQSNVVRNFYIFFFGQTIVAAVSLFLNFSHNLTGQIMALTSIVLVFILHSLTGFGKCESALNSGNNTGYKIVNCYVRYNVPLHILYSIWYLIASLLMIFK